MLVIQFSRSRIVAKSNGDTLRAELTKSTEKQTQLSSQLQAAQAELSQSQKAATAAQLEIKRLHESVGSVTQEKELLTTQGTQQFKSSAGDLTLSDLINFSRLQGKCKRSDSGTTM